MSAWSHGVGVKLVPPTQTVDYCAGMTNKRYQQVRYLKFMDT